jgi:hypothetical protein
LLVVHPDYLLQIPQPTDSIHDLQCGGEKGALAAAEPYLKLMGKNIVNCGQSGNGQAAKVYTCILVPSLQSMCSNALIDLLDVP